MQEAEYQKAENWYGSYYEFALELGPCGDDALVMQALKTLWGQPELEGPWNDRRHYGRDPDPIVVSSSDFYFYGSLGLKRGESLGCVSHVVRVQGESDWLDLSIPTGMLELRFPVVYPLDEATNPWLLAVERVLVRLAAAVYARTPFRLGLVGEETSGSCSAAELTAEDCERSGLLVPSELWGKLNPRRNGDQVSPGLVYVPFVLPHLSKGG